MVTDPEKLKAAAAKTAAGVLAPLRLASPEDVRDSLFDVAAHIGVDVRLTRMDGLAGRLVRVGRHAIVTLNQRDGPERRRFSLAHELGHHQLHGPLNQTFACTSADMEDYQHSWVERQANHFAAALVMPDRIVQKAVNGAPPSIATVLQLAPRFGTSLTAMALRVCELSDERVAVVMSCAKGVAWAMPNAHFGFAVDRRLPKLSPYSYARDVLRGRPSQDTPSEVDGDTWLYTELRPGLALLESSILLGARESALTVLWIRET